MVLPGLTSGKGGHDLLAMKPAVLDEDVARVSPADSSAREEEPWHVGLERLGIVGRHPFVLQHDAGSFHEFPVRVIPDQQEDRRGRNLFSVSTAFRSFLLPT